LKNARPSAKARSRGPGGYLGFGLPVARDSSDVIGSLSNGRPIRELVHKHTVSLLSDSITTISVASQGASGVVNWVLGTNNGIGAHPNMQMSFSLDGVAIYLAGVAQVNIPLPGKATLLAMYDVYRIDSVEVTMYIGGLAVTDDLSVVKAAVQPLFLMATDTDDAQDTGRDSLLQYSTCQIIQPVTGKPIYVKIKPAAQIMMTHLPVTSGLGRVFSPELNMASTSTPHYGLKLCAGLGKTDDIDNQFAITFAYKFNLTCKSTR